MTDTPTPDIGKINFFPLAVGRGAKLEVGQTITGSPVRMVRRGARTERIGDIEHKDVVPGDEIISACRRWFRTTFGGEFFLRKVVAEFPNFLEVNEHIVVECKLENVLSGSGARGSMNEFSLVCKAAERDTVVSRMNFSIYRPPQLI